MLIDLLFVILGIVVLVKSADFLVESSSDLATKLGVSAVVVGAIIVGFGTSMPEMAVSATAADMRVLSFWECSVSLYG